MIPTVDKICSNSYNDEQDILQLFDDKSFKIVSGADITGQFFLDTFAFPSDGHGCISVNLEMNGGEKIIFNNEVLTIGSPPEDLESGKLYIRGILLKICYPTQDDNGDEINIEDKKVQLWIEDAASLEFKLLPLYNFFALFTNPKSNNPEDLINRIKIINQNKLYKIKVTGLIIYGEAK